MKNYLKQKFEIHQGNCLEVIENVGMVHCVVTSPPYFKKRTYGSNDHEIGNEKDVIHYINSLCDLFDKVNLHKQGSIWVNIGDKRENNSLSMVPERFAIEMMSRGWKLFDNVIWAKVMDEDNGDVDGHCMVEPATKRLNGNGWEVFYRFSKSNNPYCDHCAVRIPRFNVESQRYLPSNLMEIETSIEGRVAHNVWKVKMGQTREKHYAVFPPQLCERPIAMTCPMRVSIADKSPSERIIEMEEYDEGRGRSDRIFGKYTSLEEGDDSKKVTGRVDSGKGYVPRKPVTKGWTDVGECEAGVVLDPFCGTGTTGTVALKMGRSFIGIDLYKDFQEISQKRCEEVFDYLEKNKIDPWFLQK